MTKQDNKILMCFRWFLRLKNIGAADFEICKAIECVLEHGEGIEMAEMELDIQSAIRYRQSTEYMLEQYRKRKDLAEKLRQLDKLLESLEKQQEAKNEQT